MCEIKTSNSLDFGTLLDTKYYNDGKVWRETYKHKNKTYLIEYTYNAQNIKHVIKTCVCLDVAYYKQYRINDIDFFCLYVEIPRTVDILYIDYGAITQTTDELKKKYHINRIELTHF